MSRIANALKVEQMILGVLACALGAVLLVGLSALFAWFSYLLWNAAVVPAFSWPALTFLQAWGINLLVALHTFPRAFGHSYGQAVGK